MDSVFFSHRLIWLVVLLKKKKWSRTKSRNNINFTSLNRDSRFMGVDCAEPKFFQLTGIQCIA